jgi:hypothetical protein
MEPTGIKKEVEDQRPSGGPGLPRAAEALLVRRHGNGGPGGLSEWLNLSSGLYSQAQIVTADKAQSLQGSVWG